MPTLKTNVRTVAQEQIITAQSWLATPGETAKRLLKLLRIVAAIAMATVSLGLLIRTIPAILADFATLETVAQTPRPPAMSAPSMKNTIRPLPARISIEVRFVPQKQQRYDTLGDWTWNSSRLEIRLSREFVRKDPRYGIVLLAHELLEALLCRSTGISGRQVDAFDMTFTGEGEPGDDPSAPYHRQHQWAEGAERALAGELGVNWRLYLRG